MVGGGGGWWSEITRVFGAIGRVLTVGDLDPRAFSLFEIATLNEYYLLELNAHAEGALKSLTHLDFIVFMPIVSFQEQFILRKDSEIYIYIYKSPRSLAHEKIQCYRIYTPRREGGVQNVYIISNLNV